MSFAFYRITVTSLAALSMALAAPASAFAQASGPTGGGAELAAASPSSFDDVRRVIRQKLVEA